MMVVADRSVLAAYPLLNSRALPFEVVPPLSAPALPPLALAPVMVSAIYSAVAVEGFLFHTPMVRVA